MVGITGERDAAGDGNRLACEAERIPRPVPTLVVGEDDRGHMTQPFDLGNDACADLGVAAHERPFGLVQRAGLVKHRVRHPYLADVVE